MNERLLAIRNHFNRSQKSFGEALGVSRDVIASLESGRVPIKDALIKLICREFGVNEQWLRTGQGSMLDDSKPSILDRLAAEKNLTPREQAVVSAFLDLSPQDRAAIMRYLDSVIDHLAADSAAAAASVTDAQAAGVAAAREYMQLVDSEKEAGTGLCTSDA